MSDQKPSIGRIIHFVRGVNGDHTPGIINAVHSEETIGATLFPYNDVPFQVNTILYDEDGTDSTWHWPERD